MSSEKFIGKNGRFFVSLNQKVGWVSRTWKKFNDAMLAKQVWRLLKDQSSLFYRVFKEKYFPMGSIFEASAANGSYAWKSILKSRKVIMMGMRWRIGDGKSIDI